MKLVNRGIFLLAIIGLLVSGYLLERYVTNAPIVCGKSFGCDVVRASPYSHIFGVPLPFFGLIFYLFIAVISFIQTIFFRGKWLLLLVSSLGLIFSIYLFILEVFVIHAICFWCTVSGLISFLLFILCFIAWKRR